MTPEQQKAIAIANARKRQAEAQAPVESAPIEQFAMPQAEQLPMQQPTQMATQEPMYSGELSAPRIIGSALSNIPDIVRATPEFLSRSGQSLADFGTSREGFRTIGATGGGILGATAGGAAFGVGAPAGFVGGSMGGAALGDSAFNALASLGVVSDDKTPKSALETFKSPLEAAGTEGVYQVAGAGLAKLGGIAAKPIQTAVSKLANVNDPASKEIFKKAQDLGIDLGAVDVTNKESLRGISKVVGMLPWIGKPLKQAQAVKGEQLGNTASAILNEIAPNATLFDTGVDLSKAADKSFTGFSRLAGANYDKFYNLAENLPVKEVFPSQPVRDTLQSIIKNQSESSIVGAKQLDSETSSYLKSILDNLPENLTVKQVRGLQKDMNDLVKMNSTSGKDVGDAFAVKKSLDASLGNPDVTKLPQDMADELVSSLRHANEFYANNIKRYQTATAKKFGRVDKEIFSYKLDKAGTRPEDQTFAAVFDAKSPIALKELREVVGDKAFRQASRQHLDNVFRKSLVQSPTDSSQSVFSPNAFVKQLGLDTDEGAAVIKELTKGTKVNPEMLKDFSEIARRIGDVPIGDPNTFLTRRLTLGGLAAAGGGMYGLSVGKTLGGLLLGRRFFDVMSSPEHLKKMMKITDPTVSDLVRRRLMVQLLIGTGEAKNSKEANEILKGE